MKTLLLLLLPLFAFGCANSGVVKISPDTYMICRSSGAGAFTNMPKLKVKVIQDANRFAAKQGKQVEAVKLSDTFPAHGFPSVEYQFRLVDITNAPAKP